MIQLPTPTLGNDAWFDPKATISSEARIRSVSVGEAQAEARREIEDWLRMSDELPDRFDEVLGH